MADRLDVQYRDYRAQAVTLVADLAAAAVSTTDSNPFRTAGLLKTASRVAGWIWEADEAVANYEDHRKARGLCRDAVQAGRARLDHWNAAGGAGLNTEVA
jgi:hypothetical protein